MPKLNKVKERMIFLSPTVQAGWEDESSVADFDVIKSLGQGAFGKVYKVCHKKSKLIYAIKEMNKSQLKYNNMIEQVVNEIKIMYSLNNDYIIKLYNHFEDEKNIYLVIEFAMGGQLYQNLFKQPGKRFPEKTAAKYILQLAESLEYIHTKKIIHRDIKPENILIDGSDNVKLADFGWSNYLKPDETRSTFCGTLDYLAPEMVEKGSKHDEKVDIWSVGVLAFELLTGSSPFSPADLGNKKPEEVEEDTQNNIRGVKFSFPKDFPQLAKDFVSKILVKNKDNRLTTSQMKKHPWLVENCPELRAFVEGKYEDELKKIRNAVGEVKIAEEEKVLKNNDVYNPFSQEEIFKYSRPDSIINKEFDETNKNKLNYMKNFDLNASPSFDLLSTSSETKWNQIIDKLNARIKELENRNRELEVQLAKQQKPGASEFSTLDTKTGNQIKLLEEKNSSLKAELDQTWKNCLEKQKQLNDVMSQKKTLEHENESNESKRKKMKEEISDLKSQIALLAADNEELRSKGKPEEKKGELLDQFDDYLDKLKKKHQQELEQLTKK